jgi:hypothetical protein
MTDESHPLFPEREGDLTAPLIASIHVSRYERGRMRFSPIKFGPDDLRSLEDVYRMFGGGVYELVAKDHRNKISRKERVEIAGNPLPLAPDEQPGDPSAADVASVASSPMPAQAGAPSEPMLMMMLQMMKQGHEAQMASNAQNTQVLVAMLNRGQDSSKDYVQAMGNLQGQFMQALAQNQGGGGGQAAVNSFLKGVEMAGEIRAGAEEAAGGDDNTIGQIIQGVQMALSMSQQQPGAGAPVPGVPPGTTPAQVAAVMNAQAMQTGATAQPQPRAPAPGQNHPGNGARHVAPVED